MNSKDLKKGGFLRWVADRDWSPDIDTYCKIVKIDDKNIKLFCYDDFKTVEISKTGNAVNNEIRLAEKDDVIDFLENGINNIENRKTKLTMDFNKEIKSLDRDLLKTNENLAKLKEK